MSISQVELWFRKLNLWFHNLRNCLLAWCNCLPMAITSLFQLWFAHHLKRWTPDFPNFEMKYSMYGLQEVLEMCPADALILNFFMLDSSLYFSFLHSWLALAKCYEAPKLSFFMNLSFKLVCHELYKDLSHSWIALVIKKLSKTPKLNTIWLETLARVLNVSIELKGNNYYSKVFKRVNYKL